MLKQSLRIIEWTIIIFLITVIFFQHRVHREAEKSRDDNHSSKIVAATKEVFKLAVLELQFNQVYEFSKSNLKVSKLTIPFTSQQSVVAVSGSGLFGFDIKRIRTTYSPENNHLAIVASTPTMLSLDLDYRFIDENDTFLNRISANDRTEMLKEIRMAVEADLNQEAYQEKTFTRIKEAIGQLEKVFDTSIDIEIDPPAPPKR